MAQAIRLVDWLVSAEACKLFFSVRCMGSCDKLLREAAYMMYILESP